MVLCSVPWCKNRSDHRNWKRRVDNDNKDLKITFHSFPKDATTRSLWLDILEINSPSISSKARICSIYFDDNFLDRSTPSLVRLKPNALPNKNPETEALHEVCHSDTVVPLASSSITDVSTLKPSVSTSDKATMVSFDQVYNSPEKCRLRRRIEYVKEESRKKIRNPQQNLRRQNDQIANLKNVLKTLRDKQLLNEEQEDMLHVLGGSNGAIFKRLIQQRSDKSVARQYEPELRLFALTLHYYSPRAYEYVRNQFDCCLPHVKTISSWYKSVDGTPGISTEALNSITERVKNTDYKLFASLQFDEMAIREHLEYDGSKFSGYIDMGPNIACDHTTLACQALVFLIVCINGTWKVPIAYYLIKGIGAQEKSTLILECIKAVHATGLIVVSVTCDGSSTNVSAFKKLGCNLDDPCLLQTSFLHPVTNEKVVAFLQNESDKYQESRRLSTAIK